MAVAFLSAQRSRDPNTQVGACIVNQENKIVAIGYNKMPNGCEGKMPWAREAKNWLDNKYPYVCHAELNAIMNSNGVDLRGCTMYVSLFPCNECAKLIIQAGIRKVIYLSDKYRESREMVASRRMLETAGVFFRTLLMPKKIKIDFNSIEPRSSEAEHKPTVKTQTGHSEELLDEEQSSTVPSNSQGIAGSF
ncbi:uncharacterized protein V6R79_007415 [Siganus canaliculatus]